MLRAAWIVNAVFLRTGSSLSSGSVICGIRRHKGTRQHVQVCAQVTGGRAIEVIERVYEDTSDGAMAHHRWIAARAEAEETGLSKTHGTALVYGDVDLRVMLRGLEMAQVKDGDGIVDIGSGYGRVVLAAACAYDGGEGVRVRSVSGIEILPMLHWYAKGMERKIRDEWKDLPKTNFLLGDFRECAEAEQAIREADVVFAFATTWSGVDGIASALAETLKKCLKVGARAVLLDARLPGDEFDGKRFALRGRFEEENAATGSSTVSVYEVEMVME